MTVKVLVSDHALLRYIERHLGVPVDKLREEINEKARPAAAVGAASFAVGDVKFVLKPRADKTIVVATTLERWMAKTNRFTRKLKKNRKEPT